MEKSKKQPISVSQLRDSYLKIAKEIHPDHNLQDTTATQKFQTLQENYQKCLSIIKFSNNQYQTRFVISLAESINGTERYFLIPESNSKFLLKIPAGVKNNQTILFKKLNITYTESIALSASVQIQMPKGYQIFGNYILLIKYIPFWKLFFGGNIIFEGPDGNKIKVNISKNTKSGTIFKIKNRGLYNDTLSVREPLFIRLFGWFV